MYGQFEKDNNFINIHAVRRCHVMTLKKADLGSIKEQSSLNLNPNRITGLEQSFTHSFMYSQLTGSGGAP